MRFTRGLPSQAGTSIIAALVVAVILGAVALGLNALKSDSAEPGALPAAAAASNSGSGAAGTPSIPQCSAVNNTTITVSQNMDKACVCEQNQSNELGVNGYKQIHYTFSIQNSGVTAQMTVPDINDGTVVSANADCAVTSCNGSSCSNTTPSSDQLLNTAQGFASTNGATIPATVSADQPVTLSNQAGCQVDPATGLCAGGVAPANPNVPTLSDQNLQSSQSVPCTVGSSAPCSTADPDVAQNLANNNWNCGEPDNNGSVICTPPASAPNVQAPPGTSVPQPQTCSAGQVSLNGVCTTVKTIPSPNTNPLNTLASAISKNPGLTSFGLGLTTGLVSGIARNIAASNAAPYGVGTNGLVCPEPPAQPDPSECNVGIWEPVSAMGNGCVTSYQCVPNGSAQSSATPAPNAELSCAPQVADVGESVAISYSCGNSTGSSGGGFSTGNQTSGSVTQSLAAPPAGDNTASYGLTCEGSDGQTAGAQCSIEVDQPAIVLVANPASVAQGQAATIGWVTAGMQSCVVSSPDDPNFTSENAGNLSPSGVAQTDAIDEDLEFDLSCTSYGGQTETASTTITVGSASATSATSTNS